MEGAYSRRVQPHQFRVYKPGGLHMGSLDIELTERCNNDCIHCCINLPAGDRQARAREMTTDQVRRILRQAADLGVIRVRFTGGEPLLRPDFEELYLFTRRLGIKVLLFTNARLLTPLLVEMFANIPLRAPIEITVYGLRPASYDAVSRVPGSFAQFRRGVELLSERNIPYVLKSVVLPPNQEELEEFEAWAGSIPWQGDRRPSLAMFYDLRNRRDDLEKNRQIERFRLSPESGLRILIRDEERFRKERAEFAARFMGPAGDHLLNCGIGQGMTVDAYGRAQPCLGIRAPELTLDLFPPTAGLDGIGLGTALEHFRSLAGLTTTNPEYLRRCARCFLKGLCEQCPAKSWAEYGTLDTPVEYLCQVAHAQAVHLGWLQEGEHAWEVEDWQSRLNGPGGNGEQQAAGRARANRMELN